MTHITRVDPELSEVGYLDRNYVDWGAIIGGALVAVAVFTILTVFGSAVGLSLTSAEPAQGVSVKLAAIAVAIWTAWIAVLSFAAGGYITGRLRHRIGDATEHEVRMRDGVHGLIAWSLAAIVSALLLASSIGVAATSAAKEAARTTRDYQLAALFRGEAAPVDRAVRQDAESMLKTITARKGLVQADEGYLAQLVKARTSASPTEAKARVDSIVQSIRNSLDQARKAAVLAAFLAAASLAIAAAAAWGAAIAGGKHRDEGVLLSPLIKWD